ncbi:hypothetical protein [Paraburkholderia kururiensis]|uniref:hypothetical protein n=1 Tax=Paraburkholderia kururiensis TaxID=984307 RepID=UPI001360B62B|nr:hypothetical protein [Paraburkholderia kururiensis]
MALRNGGQQHADEEEQPRQARERVDEHHHAEHRERHAHRRNREAVAPARKTRPECAPQQHHHARHIEQRAGPAHHVGHFHEAAVEHHVGLSAVVVVGGQLGAETRGAEPLPRNVGERDGKKAAVELRANAVAVVFAEVLHGVETLHDRRRDFVDHQRGRAEQREAEQRAHETQPAFAIEHRKRIDEPERKAAPRAAHRREHQRRHAHERRGHLQPAARGERHQQDRHDGLRVGPRRIHRARHAHAERHGVPFGLHLRGEQPERVPRRRRDELDHAVEANGKAAPREGLEQHVAIERIVAPRHEQTKRNEHRERPVDHREGGRGGSGPHHAHDVGVEEPEHHEHERHGAALAEHTQVREQREARERDSEHRRDHHGALRIERAVHEVGKASHFGRKEEQPAHEAQVVGRRAPVEAQRDGERAHRVDEFDEPPLVQHDEQQREPEEHERQAQRMPLARGARGV